MSNFFSDLKLCGIVILGSGQQSSRGARVLLNEELIRQRLEQRNVELESQQSTGGSTSASHQGEENPPAVLPSSTSEENPPAVLPSSTGGYLSIKIL